MPLFKNLTEKDDSSLRSKSTKLFTLAALYDAKGSGRNRTSMVMMQNLIDGKPSSGSFAMSLMLKDMNQAIQLGFECGAPTTITNVVRGLLQIGVNTLGETAQLEEVVGLVESMAATHIVETRRSA